MSCFSLCHWHAFLAIKQLLTGYKQTHFTICINNKNINSCYYFVSFPFGIKSNSWHNVLSFIIWRFEKSMLVIFAFDQQILYPLRHIFFIKVTFSNSLLKCSRTGDIYFRFIWYFNSIRVLDWNLLASLPLSLLRKNKQRNLVGVMWENPKISFCSLGTLWNRKFWMTKRIKTRTHLHWWACYNPII